MRYIDAWKMEGCVYTIYQNNEGNRFYIFRKEKDGNSNQLRVAFKSAEDAKAWVNNVLIPAWQNWHDCNKLAGQAYLDDPDELNETKNTNKNTKKNTIKLNESQLRNIIKESVKKVLKEDLNNTYRGIEGTNIVKNSETGKDEIYFEGYRVDIHDFERYLKYCFEDFVKDEIESVKKEFTEEMGIPLALNNNCYEAWIKWLGSNVMKEILYDWVSRNDDDDVINESKANMTIRDVIQYGLNKYGNNCDKGICKELLEFAGVEPTQEWIEKLSHLPTHYYMSAFRKVINTCEKNREKIAKTEIKTILSSYY